MMVKIDTTKSFCPKCMKVLDADIVSKRGIVYIRKKCDEHGSFEVRHSWDQEKIYKMMAKIPKFDTPDSLVLHITSKCNQNCPFCYAMANDNKYELSMNRIKNILKKFKGKWILLSGGEPTVREDVFDIIKLVKKMKFKALLCTNGKKLADEEFVKKLKDSGLDVVNLQFDSLNDKTYLKLRGQRLLENKMKALKNLKKYKIDTTLFVMLIKNINIKEIRNILNFASKNTDFIKIIYLERAWKVGRTLQHKDTNSSDVIKELKKQANINSNEIIEVAEFYHYLHVILKKMKGTDALENAGCELNCFIMFKGNEVVPLSRILFIKKINTVLKFVYGNKFFIPMKTIVSIPYISYILFKSFVEKKYFRAALNEFIKLRKGVSLKTFDSPFTQLIIRVEPEREDVDLNICKNYNFYSDIIDSDNIIPAYYRHMIINKLK